MPILNPKPGSRYLTVTGAPVLVLEVQDGGIMAQGLASDNRFYLPIDYPLSPFKPDAVAWDMRSSPYTPRLARPTLAHAAVQKQLAPIIDALLLKGGLTMQGLVREIKRRASAACRGKDVRANIRARLYWFKRKGCRIKKNGQSQLKVIRQMSDDPQGWGSLRLCQLEQ